ncbi:hypothetical protein RS130_23130 [Paraglaciecola aquimarina]|uniref:Uncharacterized protein n=1 Tax=Paraglaciecola aquimarina TaxID=1235557 RepID=A0ABU3T2B1_9ALTE|nr:hypothetical protein [Paraglaciecola aquimarina]MDU0356400.1 hypothetical protein [Paraglaciecola aquimarina]
MQTDSIRLYMGDDYLHMQFDKSEFAISATRIGVLAVMLEFIVNIEPAQLAHIEQSLIGASTDAIKQLSSRLQKLIYSYLKQHIPEAST